MKIVDVPVKFLTSKGVKNPKYVVYGALAVIAVIGGIVIYRKIKRISGGKWTSGSTQERLTDELSNLATSGATLTEGEAIIISQNLLNAMDQWGTDEAAIIDNLSRCKNKADLNLVIQTFGIKPYDGMGLADTFLSRQIAGVMKNLNGWLRQELSGKELEKVKDIYNNLNVPF